jgi:hypothetical protein
MVQEEDLIVEVRLAPNTDAGTEARKVLRNALRTWELDGLGDVTELLATELVANVVRHVGLPMTLRAIATPDRTLLRVEVDDPSPEPPVVQRPSLTATGGRGMLLVDSLASRWGVAAAHDGTAGKMVWFEIDFRTATEEIHGD